MKFKSIWERSPLASTAVCGLASSEISSSTLITAVSLSIRFLYAAYQQVHLVSLSFCSSSLPFVNIWAWHEHIQSFQQREKTCSYKDIFDTVNNDKPCPIRFSLYSIPNFSRHDFFFLVKLAASKCSCTQGSSPEPHHHNSTLRPGTAASFSSSFFF